MSIYASTSSLHNHSYTETLSEYERMGIEAVEMGYCPETDIVLDEITNSHEFDWVAHNYFMPVSDEFVLNLSSPDNEILQRSISYVRDGIDFCARHGIGTFTFHSGFRVDPDENLRFETEEVPSASSCMERFIQSLENILPYAEECGVSVAIENNVIEPKHVVDGDPIVLMADPKEFLTLLNRIDVDILLDIGHLNIASETLDFDREKFLDVVEAHVSHVHLHTNDGVSDEHRPVGRGDWAFEAWKRFDAQPTTVEAKFDNADDIAEHVRWLSECSNN
jgi:sugar phosphate isomerase/epimerase